MNFFLIISALVFNFSAFAALKNSKLELRHQELIEKSITSKCNLTRGFIEEIVTKTIETRVDQGITDYQYETLLEVHERLDQNLYDIYEVTVRSSYSDMYDHSTQDWGAYSIESVSTCVMK